MTDNVSTKPRDLMGLRKRTVIGRNQWNGHDSEGKRILEEPDGLFWARGTGCRGVHGSR